MRSRHIVRSVTRMWFRLIQIMTIPANAVVTWLLRLTIHRPQNLVVQQGTLIIANHQSKIDPFLISYHIGFKNIFRTIPIRYPVTPEYIRRPLLGKCIQLLGGYTIGETPIERLHQLIYTRTLLKSGYTVLLFPEGEINRDSDMVIDFKRGAHVLFNEQYPILLVRLTGLNKIHRFRFWKNKGASLTYSEYLDASHSPTDKIEYMEKFYTDSHERVY